MIPLSLLGAAITADGYPGTRKGGSDVARANLRSFRLSPEPYMVGKRVIRRMRYVHLGVCLLRTLLVCTSIVLFFLLLAYIPAIHPRSRPYGIIGAVGPFLMALLMDFIGFRLGRHLALRHGLITEEEAQVFHRRMDRWPPNWVEDVPGSSQVHPLDDPNETG